MNHMNMLKMIPIREKVVFIRAKKKKKRLAEDHRPKGFIEKQKWSFYRSTSVTDWLFLYGIVPLVYLNWNKAFSYFQTTQGWTIQIQHRAIWKTSTSPSQTPQNVNRDLCYPWALVRYRRTVQIIDSDNHCYMHPLQTQGTTALIKPAQNRRLKRAATLNQKRPSQKSGHLHKQPHR